MTFTLKDRSGKNMDINTLIPGAGRGRLGFTLAPLAVDYGKGFGTAATAGYLQEAPTSRQFLHGRPWPLQVRLYRSHPGRRQGHLGDAAGRPHG